MTGESANAANAVTMFVMELHWRPAWQAPMSANTDQSKYSTSHHPSEEAAIAQLVAEAPKLHLVV